MAILNFLIFGPSCIMIIPSFHRTGIGLRIMMQIFARFQEILRVYNNLKDLPIFQFSAKCDHLVI
jgi:hypothetical protein